TELPEACTCRATAAIGRPACTSCTARRRRCCSWSGAPGGAWPISPPRCVLPLFIQRGWPALWDRVLRRDREIGHEGGLAVGEVGTRLGEGDGLHPALDHGLGSRDRPRPPKPGRWPPRVFLPDGLVVTAEEHRTAVGHGAVRAWGSCLQRLAALRTRDHGLVDDD